MGSAGYQTRVGCAWRVRFCVQRSIDHPGYQSNIMSNVLKRVAEEYDAAVCKTDVMLPKRVRRTLVQTRWNEECNEKLNDEKMAKRNEKMADEP